MTMCGMNEIYPLSFNGVAVRNLLLAGRRDTVGKQQIPRFARNDKRKILRLRAEGEAYKLVLPKVREFRGGVGSIRLGQ